jgi:hypothetical protein
MGRPSMTALSDAALDKSRWSKTERVVASLFRVMKGLLSNFGWDPVGTGSLEKYA